MGAEERGNLRKSKQLTVLDTTEKSMKWALKLSPGFGQVEDILLRRIVPWNNST